MKKWLKLIIKLFIATLFILIILFIFIYNNSSNKLKRYLKKNNYECVDSICRTNINDVRYDIDIKTGMFKVLSVTHEFIINDNYYQYTDYLNSKICKYSNDNYKKGLLVDESFEYENSCSDYIDNVNEFVNKYNDIFKNSKVNVKG